MRINATIASAAVALSLSALTPLAAVAADRQIAYTVSPISVKSCSINEGDIVTPYPSPIRTATGLNVTFSNTSSAPVSNVQFVIGYNGQSETVDDKGTFSPNVTIAHDLRIFNDAVNSGGSANCTVAKVDFADGTTWQAPASRVASAPVATDTHR
jgi:hypothetical protein